MTEHQTSRTLVKSHPELWAQCSDATSLARHLDRFGEIRITRLEPETAVAWEGEDASGTVRLEPSGWGTRVIMTAVSDQAAPAAAPARVHAPAPARIADPGQAPPDLADSRPWWLPGLMARMRWRRGSAEPGVEPAAVVEPAAAPAADGPAEPAAELAALTAALESLGKAHHRPFSRP